MYSAFFCHRTCRNSVPPPFSTDFKSFKRIFLNLKFGPRLSKKGSSHRPKYILYKTELVNGKTMIGRIGLV